MLNRIKMAALAVALGMASTACSSNTTDTTSSGGGGATTASAPGKDSSAVGFIYVGPKDDFGYNQAAYEGSGRRQGLPGPQGALSRERPGDR